MTHSSNDHRSQPPSDKQVGFMRLLARELGFADVTSALSSMGLDAPTTVDEASAIIDAFKVKRGPALEPAAAQSTAKYLTARRLRRIDQGQETLPGSIDDDAAWVLKRLAKMREVETVLGSAPRWQGVNDGGPILVEQLIAYFGSTDRVAAEFKVSVATVKGWGTHLPANRAYEAQVRTQSHVCAPESSR